MSVVYHKDAIKALEQMDRATRTRIIAAIERIPEGEIKPLKGTHGYFRLRVGGWRILFSRPDNESVFIVDIGPRGDIYKGG
jgi:mRNA interferase RelE/StbE